MSLLFPFFILIFGSICIRLTEGKVYHVMPVMHLISCPGNNSCPPGQLCHTMDYLAEHGSELFSPDHVNVTLIFMCGVHNYTKELIVQNLHSFIMKGAAESRKNVIIDHQFGMQVGKPNCTIIQFFNVSFVNISTLTMRCPALNLRESHITVKSSNLYGYPGIKESLSFINITGRCSQALLDNCTFKENCFVTSNYSNGIIVSNSIFQSYRHQFHSIIEALSSIVTLTGNVNFTDSVTGMIRFRTSMGTGTALCLQTTHPDLKSSLNITTGATVYFVNLTCSSYGGAVYGENAMIHIGDRTRVVFMYNTAIGDYEGYGGAVYMSGAITIGVGSYVTFAYNHAFVGGAIWLGDAYYGEYQRAAIHISAKVRMVFMYNSAQLGGGAVVMQHGMITVGAESCVIFTYNHAIATNGGAVGLINGTMIVDCEANLIFSHNSAVSGGALDLRNSTAHINTSGVKFYNNRASLGGAMYLVYGTMYINANNSIKFIMNSAQVKGGAIYIEAGIRPSITIGNYSKLFFFDNSAFQGGALYSIMPPLFMTTVGHQSIIQLVNNTAFDVGGAVYSQSSPPCIFMITDYFAKISFTGNHAQRGVGHHMYGASIRDASCSRELISFVNEQGKPHCFYRVEEAFRYIRISFDPGLNKTLSPVSSDPQRVCLCDSSGKPQCANISYIFKYTSIYRGETITLPACIVGYDFGTTVGTIHARSLYSDFLSKQDKSQLVINSEECVAFNYTVYSKRNYELLLLQTSSLPVSAYISNKSTENDIFNYEDKIKGEISDYISHYQFGCIRTDILTTPIFINITLLPGCPPGLTLNHDETTCSCYPVLTNNGFNCLVKKQNWSPAVERHCVGECNLQ